MAHVMIPSLLHDVTGGETEAEIPGRNIREVLNGLEAMFPGIQERLMKDGRLRPHISVWVDGEQARGGMIEPVGERSEVHFLPAISGGAPGPLS